MVDEESHLPKKHLQAFDYCNFYHPVHRVPELASIINLHYAYPEAMRLNYGLGKKNGTELEPNGPGGGSPTLRKQLKILRDFLDGSPCRKPEGTSACEPCGTTGRPAIRPLAESSALHAIHR